MVNRAIGLFGGTFDPIHFGHLRSAIEISEQLNLDEIRLIPCKIPPHRTSVVDAENRLTMTRLAVEGTHLIVDDREMYREGPSYTVDTLMSLRSEYPHASLCMIIGVDAFLGFSTWHQWEKILELTNIVVMHRPNWKMPTSGVMAEFIKKYPFSNPEALLNSPAGKITECAITILDISASHIRNLLQKNRSTQFLLPEKVIAYIKEHQLYSTKDQIFKSQTEVAHI